MQCWFFGLILAAVSTGCAPIPVPVKAFSKQPYPSEVLQRLAQKDADRTLVIQTLGNPRALRSAGRYWFYASIRDTVGFIGAGVVFQDFEWLAVRYDDSDHVTSLEYSDDVSGCLSDGICNYSGLLYSNPSLAVLSAPRAEDERIKSYQVHVDECVLYVYQEPVSFKSASGPVVVSIDGKAQGVINYKTYLFLKHSPGYVHIGAYQFRITTQCRGGEKVYVKAVESWKSFETGQGLFIVVTTEGEAAILSRQLALPY